MRILMLNHFPLEGSGSGVYVRQLATRLAAMGHELEVLIPETQQLYTQPEGFVTHTVLFREDPSVGGDSDPELENRIAPPSGTLPFPFPCFTTHPRSHYTFYEMGPAEMTAYRGAFKEKLAQRLLEFDPEILHAGHLWVLGALARETGRPYVVTAHGTDLMGYEKDPRFRADAQHAAEGACRVITISRQVDEAVAKVFGVSDTDRRLIYSGCDLGLFYPRTALKEKILGSLGLGAGAPVVCFAGKLTAFKGVDLLLEAAALYEKHLGGAVVTLIAGDGAQQTMLRAKARALGLKGVHFIGHQTQEALGQLYSVSDVFAMPSRTEPFGLAALEALACGLPVVGTDAGGLPDIITPEVGRLVPLEDPTALAQALMAFLTWPPDQRQHLKERCVRHVADHFSWKTAAEETLKVYQRCLEVRSQR